MSYTVRYRRLEVVCETPQEVEALAELADSQARAHSQPKIPGQPIELRLAASGVNGNGQSPSIKGLMARLKPNAQKILKTIARNGGRMSDSDLSKSMHAKNAMALAGMMGPLYKMARLAEAKGLPQFFQKDIVANDQGGSSVDYIIPPEALDEVREGLKL
jgi:hypothetical protein